MKTPITKETLKGATEVVNSVLAKHIAAGTLFDSDMFKYTPAYTGDAWNDKSRKKGTAMTNKDTLDHLARLRAGLEKYNTSLDRLAASFRESKN